jgi:hypothetical protein
MVILASNPGTSSIKTTGFVADLVSLQDFREWIDMFSNDQWYEDIRSTLFSYLDSCNIFSQEDKFDCLKKLVKELEIEQKTCWFKESLKIFFVRTFLLKIFMTNNRRV